MRLLEREQVLALLRARLHHGGGTVLLSGEAGAGKSSVVRALLGGLGAGESLLGRCDSLRTARPLAPFLDWVPDRQAEVDVDAVLPAVERALDAARVAVVEDLHWADDATLDLLSVLVRRPRPGRAVLVLTFRDDEVGAGHPLRLLLGDVAATGPVRVALPPLSVEAVAELVAGSGLPAADLHARTGGNPFFVTECLAAGVDGVPEGVRDAVLARAARVGPAARDALDALVCVPDRCELWLAERLGATSAGLDEALVCGLVVADDAGRLALRHDLARQALHDALLPGRRRDLHAAAVAALVDPPAGPVDSARVVHHALLAGDGPRVREHAPRAAEQALAAGARSQAVDQLRHAVAHARPDDDVLPLLEQLGAQHALLGQDDEAVAAYRRAVDQARAQGDGNRTAVLLSRLCVPLTTSGRVPQAREAVAEAVALVGDDAPEDVRAVVHGQACSLHMLARELGAARRWGASALQAARAAGDRVSAVYAQVQAGVAAWMDGDEAGLQQLREAVEEARSAGLVAHVVHGLSQVGSGGGEVRRYAEAVPALQEAVALAEQNELGSRGRYAHAWLGRCQVELGQWDDAAATLSAVLRSPRTETITRITALTALGRLRTRRGDPGAGELLDEALALALPTGQLQRVWPVAVARAEQADLEGEPARELALLREVHGQASALAYPWAQEELALWLARAGEELPATAVTPFGLQLAGQVQEAARAWAALGCPYEQAEALAERPEGELEALRLLQGLDAVPAVRRLVGRRRAAGRPVPRGPNTAARGTPSGLTPRELDVLRLVARGLTTPQVAAALHLSPKTVGHHVTHVLDKLGARSRAEAVHRAVALGVPLD